LRSGYAREVLLRRPSAGMIAGSGAEGKTFVSFVPCCGY
jgi:hypothetical protein